MEELPEDDFVGKEDIDESELITIEGEEEILPEHTIVDDLIKDSEHRIIRVVKPEDRVTSHFISESEFVEAIGIRAVQIEKGSPVFTDVSGLDNPIAQARKEFFDRKSPLLLHRKIAEMPDEIIVEEWKVREMSFPFIRDIDLTNKQIQELISKKINNVT
ncbi:MAG: hypothetical protein QW303_03185 [Nitrososphaerota archaeon]